MIVKNTTQEDIDLLLRDLCARIPYNVKCQYSIDNTLCIGKIVNISSTGRVNIDGHIKDICDIKPYLFPISSIKQSKLDRDQIRAKIIDGEKGYYLRLHHFTYDNYPRLFTWFNENHIDYNSFIEKGLANDATGLSIYRKKKGLEF